MVRYGFRPDTPYRGASIQNGVVMRASFSARFELATVVIHVHDCCDLTVRERARIVELLNRYGFVILRYQRSEEHRQQLLGLSGLLGGVVRHRRSDSDGIAPITPSSEFPGYYGTSSGPHPPHTDGAFDRVPPKFSALQCLVSAVDGGRTQLVSGVGIYNAIGRENPEALSGLFRADALTVCRGEQGAQAAVFSMAHGLVQMRFRDDTTSSFAEHQDVAAGIDIFRRYVANPDNVVEFRLEPQHILVVDNRGVLHGRTAFDPSSGRLLLRATFDGEACAQRGLESGFSATADRS